MVNTRVNAGPVVKLISSLTRYRQSTNLKTEQSFRSLTKSYAMTVDEARFHLSRPLVFGDRDQITARQILEDLAEALERLPLRSGNDVWYGDDELVQKWRRWKEVNRK